VEIAQGIFNEPLATTTEAGGRHHIRLEKENAPFCRVYRFIEHIGRIDDGDLTTEDTANGTLLKITRQGLDSGCENLPVATPLYFRLRIMLAAGCSAFVRTITPHDQWFQSGFEEVEYVDFRLNEVRSLPGRIEQLISTGNSAGGNAAITKVAFLTAIPVSANLTASNFQSYKARLLEHQIWTNYVADIPEGMMV
jgi:hypothetical protein